MSNAEREPTQGGGKLDISVKVYPVQDSKNLLANASVTIGGCFAIRGVRVLNSEKGPFVAMPQRKTAEGEYKDICFPTTAEMRKELNSMVLGEYHRAVEKAQSKTESRNSVLGDVRKKSSEVKPPTAGTKAADKGER